MVLLAAAVSRGLPRGGVGGGKGNAAMADLEGCPRDASLGIQILEMATFGALRSVEEV